MKLTLIVFFTLGLLGCGSTPANVAPIIDDALKQADYVIGIGDDIQVNVWKNTELTVAVPVRPDGQISMPLVGDIRAAGETAKTLSASITEKLNTYIRNPQVTVIVSNPVSADFQKRIRITGAVASQQSMPYRDGMTILDLVLDAGGPTEFANANKTKLYRKENGVVKVYSIRLDDILNKGKLDTNYQLMPSDIVTVPERVF